MTFDDFCIIYYINTTFFHLYCHAKKETDCPISFEVFVYFFCFLLLFKSYHKFVKKEKSNLLYIM